MDGLWLIFYWTGPIGIGAFLVSLGVLIWLLSKANDINKRTKAWERQQEREKG